MGAATTAARPAARGHGLLAGYSPEREKTPDGSFPKKRRLTYMSAMARSYTPYHPGLLTDLYHPDSAYVAWRAGRAPQTTFDLYSRRAPFGGAYLLVAGLQMALEFVRSFAYTDE